ncbi:putative histone H1.6 [Ciona intestinalis]
MSDSTLPTVPVPSSAIAKKKKSTTKTATSATKVHPKYSDMIVSAVKTLRRPKGSSRQAITKYVQSNYDVGTGAAKHISRNLKSMVDKDELVLASGVGAAGRFRINKTAAAGKARTTKQRKSPKKKKKPVTKKNKRKTTAKKTRSPVKKRSAKKSPKKKLVKKNKKTVKKAVKKPLKKRK